MRQIYINFHGVGNPPAGTDKAELCYWWDEEAFMAALDLVRATGEENNCSILITFDDGNESDAKIAMPALVERGLKAKFFVCAGRVGTPNYLDKAGIAELLSAGMSVGSHGMNHVDWRRISRVDLDVEISQAIDELEQICDREVSELAIPFGKYDRRVMRALRKANLRTVFTSDGGYALSNSWLHPRNTLDRAWQGRDFLQTISQEDTIQSRIKRNFIVAYKAIR